MTKANSECLFCGGEVAPFGPDHRDDLDHPLGSCLTCSFPFVITGNGAKLTKDVYESAFDRPAQDPDRPMRSELTMKVQDALYKYVTGEDVPHERLRKLVALLIDLHCDQERFGIMLAKLQRQTEVELRSRFEPRYPAPRPRPGIRFDQRRPVCRGCGVVLSLRPGAEHRCPGPRPRPGYGPMGPMR